MVIISRDGNRHFRVPNFQGFTRCLLLAGVLVLAACGGGGGGKKSPPITSVSSVSATSSSNQSLSSISSASQSDSSAANSSAQNSSTASSVSAGVSSSASSVSSQGSSSAPANLPPHVSAGARQTVLPGTLVTFSASAFDEDGEVVDYLWQQTSGSPNVTIDAADTLTASFAAPATASESELHFRLTVTDDDGAQAQASVTITVLADGNAPLVSMDFPPPQGVYKDETISAFGRVTPPAGAVLTSLEVTAGGDVVEATVDNDGYWRANGILTPVSDGDFAVTVTAQDDQGRVARVQSDLRKSSDVGAGGGIKILTPESVLYDSSAGTAWILTGGGENTRIVPVNLKTGFGGAPLVTIPHARRMIFNAEKTSFIVAVSPATAGNVGSIYSVNKATGAMTLISGPGKGDGDDLLAPVALALGTQNRLYVAENAANRVDRIMQVDLSTGSRTIFAEGIGSQTISASSIAFSQTEGILLVLRNSANSLQIVSFSEAIPPQLGLVIDTDTVIAYEGDIVLSGNRALVVACSALSCPTGITQVTGFSNGTGTASILATDVTRAAVGVRRFDFAPLTKLMYVTGGGLYVIDAETGSSVAINRVNP